MCVRGIIIASAEARLLCLCVCVRECVSHVAKWRCEQRTDGKGLGTAETWLLSLLLKGESLRINNKHTVKENVWECDSAHRKSPGNLQIWMAGSQCEDAETLPAAIFRVLHLVINCTLE